MDKIVNKHALMSLMGVLGNGNYFYIHLSFPDQIAVGVYIYVGLAHIFQVWRGFRLTFSNWLI